MLLKHGKIVNGTQRGEGKEFSGSSVVLQSKFSGPIKHEMFYSNFTKSYTKAGWVLLRAYSKTNIFMYV